MVKSKSKTYDVVKISKGTTKLRPVKKRTIPKYRVVLQEKQRKEFSTNVTTDIKQSMLQ